MTPGKKKERKQASSNLSRALEHSLAYGQDNKEALDYFERAKAIIEKAQLDKHHILENTPQTLRRYLSKRITEHVYGDKGMLPADKHIMLVLGLFHDGAKTETDILNHLNADRFFAPLSAAILPALINALMDNDLIITKGDKYRITENGLNLLK